MIPLLPEGCTACPFLLARLDGRAPLGNAQSPHHSQGRPVCVPCLSGPPTPTFTSWQTRPPCSPRPSLSSLPGHCGACLCLHRLTQDPPPTPLPQPIQGRQPPGTHAGLAYQLLPDSRQQVPPKAGHGAPRHLLYLPPWAPVTARLHLCPLHGAALPSPLANPAAWLSDTSTLAMFPGSLLACEGQVTMVSLAPSVPNHLPRDLPQ